MHWRRCSGLSSYQETAPTIVVMDRADSHAGPSCDFVRVAMTAPIGGAKDSRSAGQTRTGFDKEVDQVDDSTNAYFHPECSPATAGYFEGDVPPHP